MRRSLSAVSSSTELEAVFTSTPSFFRRSMTSWLESLRSRASPKTLTFAIRPSLLRYMLGRRRGRLGRRFGFGPRALRGGLLGRGLFGGEALGLVRRVAVVPFRLGEARGLANLLDRLRAHALEPGQ